MQPGGNQSRRRHFSRALQAKEPAAGRVCRLEGTVCAKPGGGKSPAQLPPFPTLFSSLSGLSWGTCYQSRQAGSRRFTLKFEAPCHVGKSPTLPRSQFARLYKGGDDGHPLPGRWGGQNGSHPWKHSVNCPEWQLGRMSPRGGGRRLDGRVTTRDRV